MRGEVVINYTNWKGETSDRTILPLRMFWGSNQWHKEEQWLLEAFDKEKHDTRTFAMKDIHSWKQVEGVLDEQ